jgi:hypothetical protein
VFKVKKIIKGFARLPYFPQQSGNGIVKERYTHFVLSYFHVGDGKKYAAYRARNNPGYGKKRMMDISS